MTQDEIRQTAMRALNDMARADTMLQKSHRESIPSVAKLLREDSAVLYRSAVLTLKDAVSKLT